MSILSWLILAVVAYFAHNAYQRIQFSRKKAEFIRDRRRAAGIPDDDNRPFAIARADALSRRSQQRRGEPLSTPVKKRSSGMTPSRSHVSIDHEAAARLSGIPGTLPGYLKDTLTSSAVSTSTQSSRYRPAQHRPSNPLRSPSPVKQSVDERSSSQRELKSPTIRRQSPANDSHKAQERPSNRRRLKRNHSASPSNSEISEQDTVASDRNKVSKVSIPGTFGAEQSLTDEEMSDAASKATGSDAEGMDEDENENAEVKVHSQRPNGGNTKARGDDLQLLQNAARSTAKKREADELELSDTEQSIDTSDDEEHALPQPHISKRSRTVNKDVDPSSSLDFEIALPEEAMIDFVPVHDPPSSQSKSRQGKRQADTSDDRQPGEEWVDFEGLCWRIHPETHELQRGSDVLEWRSKYRMPRDSLHPMAKESHQVVVHKWLTKEEWEDAKAKKLLSFQEPERLAEKERLDKEEAEKMRRKQELLAKIRQTSSPNKRIQSFLVQQQKRQLQHKLSRSELSGDVLMNSYAPSEADGDAASMSIDSSSMTMGSEASTPNKPRLRRISLQNRMTPARGLDGIARGGFVGPDGGSVSGGFSPSGSPKRRVGSPLASPYRAIQYSKSKNGTPANLSPLVTSTFPPP